MTSIGSHPWMESSQELIARGKSPATGIQSGRLARLHQANLGSNYHTNTGKKVFTTSELSRETEEERKEERKKENKKHAPRFSDTAGTM